jgi:hypothetical protein
LWLAQFLKYYFSKFDQIIGSWYLNIHISYPYTLHTTDNQRRLTLPKRKAIHEQLTSHQQFLTYFLGEGVKSVCFVGGRRLWCLMPLWTIFLLYRGVSFIGGEKHWPAASHWQTLSHNVVSSTPRLIGIRTHNVSSDRHWMHR